jgi:hypothetical protein
MSPETEPVAGGAPCTFEHLGWRCNGHGLLVLGSLEAKPCPRCNTGAFLREAQLGPLELRSLTGCICCAPPLIRVQWTSALHVAEQCNPAATADFLARMSHAGADPMPPALRPAFEDYFGDLGPINPARR